MNWDIVEGNWKQFKGLVKAQWSEVTHDYRDVIVGKRGELAGKIQKASPQTEGTMKEEKVRQHLRERITFRSQTPVGELRPGRSPINFREAARAA